MLTYPGLETRGGSFCSGIFFRGASDFGRLVVALMVLGEKSYSLIHLVLGAMASERSSDPTHSLAFFSSGANGVSLLSAVTYYGWSGITTVCRRGRLQTGQVSEAKAGIAGKHLRNAKTGKKMGPKSTANRSREREAGRRYNESSNSCKYWYLKPHRQLHHHPTSEK